MRRTSIYEHVVAEHHQITTTTTGPQAPQAQHSTTQHNCSTAPRSQHGQQPAKQVRADQSATTQASRRSWLAPACRRAYIPLAVFSKRTKKSKSARPTKNTAGGVLCDARRVCLYTALSVRPLYFVHTCGVQVSFGDHGALGICKSLVCTANRGPLCAIQSFAFCSILLCERA